MSSILPSLLAGDYKERRTGPLFSNDRLSVPQKERGLSYLAGKMRGGLIKGEGPVEKKFMPGLGSD